MKLRGICAPYYCLAELEDGSLEMIRANAFERMLNMGQRVALQIGHENQLPAAITADNLRLIDTADGLGFEVTLADTVANYQTLMTVINGANQASVNFSATTSHIEEIDGEEVNVIESAVIDHIAVCTATACYENRTAVWPCDMDLSRAPQHIRELAARWPNSGTPNKKSNVVSLRHKTDAMASLLGRPIGLPHMHMQAYAKALGLKCPAPKGNIPRAALEILKKNATFGYGWQRRNR